MTNKELTAQIKAGAKQAIDTEEETFLVVTPGAYVFGGTKTDLLALLAEAIKRSSPRFGASPIEVCDAIKFALKETGA